ncbi:MAG: hypothetical protein LUF26_01065 [Firmicutes bacterium]|nr:hypothetical protein [Bacillota bacterium]
MGLFGGGYDKPGKGVDKNEPKKKGFFLFFDVLIHKFSKFIGANCLYSLVSILWAAILFVVGMFMLANTGIVTSLAAAMEGTGIGEADLQVILAIMFAVSVFVLWGSGPASAAYAYVNRCFTRGEPVWVASDGKDKFKENFKQGMIVVIIDLLVLVLGMNAVHFYYSLYAESGSILWMLLTYVMVLALIIYTMMHPYLYQMMVTFECKTGALYKNALIITLAKLPGNFFLLLFDAAVLFALFLFINPIAAALIIAVIGLCITRYPGEFYAARVIERSILKDMKKKQPKIEYIEEDA